MRLRSLALLLSCLIAAPLSAQTLAPEKGTPPPKDAPPVMGTAKLVGGGPANDVGTWSVELIVPVAHWEVTGEVIAKREWPQLKSTVSLERNKLKLGGPSQLVETRFLNVKGEEVDQGEVRKRLASETPVLISLTGGAPDPYYLQLVRPDALIVVLGPRDGYPTGRYFPAEGRAVSTTERQLPKPESQAPRAQGQPAKPESKLPKPPALQKP
jgi:hypothetical protein